MGETGNTSVPLSVLQKRFDKAQMPQSERAQPLISQAQSRGLRRNGARCAASISRPSGDLKSLDTIIPAPPLAW
jgi:hypothetical protein